VLSARAGTGVVDGDDGSGFLLLRVSDRDPELPGPLVLGHRSELLHQLVGAAHYPLVETAAATWIATPVGCQNWAMGCDQRFQAAGSYSLIRPPRIGRRRILP